MNKRRKIYNMKVLLQKRGILFKNILENNRFCHRELTNTKMQKTQRQQKHA